jgi:hypothetical protein
MIYEIITERDKRMKDELDYLYQKSLLEKDYQKRDEMNDKINYLKREIDLEE